MTNYPHYIDKQKIMYSHVNGDLISIGYPLSCSIYRLSVTYDRKTGEEINRNLNWLYNKVGK